MSKFKVGDRVIIASNECDHYGFIGRIVKSDNSCLPYKVQLEDGSTHWHTEFALKSFYETIIITADGKTTRAMLKNGRQTVKEAKAVCAPEDTYNFNTGASLALNRLLYGTDYHPNEVKFTKPAVREVKRPAKVGEWVKICNVQGDGGGHGPYHNGDVFLTVKDDFGTGIIVSGDKPFYSSKDYTKYGPNCTQLLSHEYVVLENYTPDTPISEDKPIEVTINGERYIKA